MIDQFNLERFIDAQNYIYDDVIEELKNGKKKTHWIWFIFPQITGLGYSRMSKKYAIKSKAEAIAYLEHPILGNRIKECTQLVIDINEKPLLEIFGSPDNMKFHSSITLFHIVDENSKVFSNALAKYFANNHNKATIDILNKL
jgi:uncharacterized protein (DUF1810 family)